MWTREQLKTKAKEVLKTSYWWAFLVCLIFTLIAGIASGNVNTSSFTSSGGSSGRSSIDVSDYAEDLTPEQEEALQQIVDSYLSPVAIGMGIAALVISLIVTVLRAAYTIFVVNPLKVGYDRYFLDQSEGKVNFATLFSGFTGGKYMKRVKVLAFQYLYLFLWTLLFVIPGIIKSYSYFLIPYILADNPDISKDRAFEISMKTMDGEKWNLFVLQLSFIGWQLLGILACCVGTYFVAPYVQATMAEFYFVMRQKAIQTGIATPEEFNLSTGIDAGTTI